MQFIWSYLRFTGKAFIRALMKKIFLLIVASFALLLLSYQKGISQHGKLDALFARGDSTAVMDSLMQGFDAFLDSMSQPKSFFLASAGMGNRTFSIRNNALNTQETTTRQLSLTPSLAYFHKKGLGVSATGFAANLNNRYQFYQYAITPSYDYIGKKGSAGISYTRYLGKDTATLNASPYDNDLYGYFNIRRHSWRYGLALGYATGSFSDKISYADSIQRYNALLQKYEWVHYRKTIESANHIRDFSLSVSVRKDFEWDGLFSKDDNILVSFTGYLVTGFSRIKTSSHINYAAKKITLSRFKRSYDNADGNNFQLQSAALSASLFYTLRRFTLQPILFMDYYFQDTDQKFSQVFSLTFGYSF